MDMLPWNVFSERTKKSQIKYFFKYFRANIRHVIAKREVSVVSLYVIFVLVEVNGLLTHCKTFYVRVESDINSYTEVGNDWKL